MSPAATRPSPWLLAPTAAAFACYAASYGERVVLAACLIAMLGSYLHRRTLPAELLARPRVALPLWAAATGLATLYYLAVFPAAESPGSAFAPTPYPPARSWLLLRPSVVAGLGLAAALALAVVWHLDARAARKTGVAIGLAGFVATCAGNFYHLKLPYLLPLACFFAASLAAVALAGGGAGEGRALGGRALSAWGLATLAALAVAGGLTLAAARALRSAERAAIQLSMGRFGPLLPDFSGLGSGSAIELEASGRLELSSALVATLELPGPPGYLRTDVMTTYRGGRWQASRHDRAQLAPSDRLADGALRFELVPPMDGARPSPAAESERGALTPLADLAGSLPLPYGTRAVTFRDPLELLRGSDGIPMTRMASGRGSHGRFELERDAAAAATRQGIGASDPAAMSGPERELALAEAGEAPEEILAALRPLALEVAGDAASSPLVAAERIQDFFRSEFEYSFDVELSPDRDPTLDFVLRRRPAWCEYFASGMVLMLRALDIPARVAGGFAVREWSSSVDAWLVRASDAHAWCEVYDAASGRWIAFDPTPEGVTAAVERRGLASLFGPLRDRLALALACLKAWLAALARAEGLAGLRPLLTAALTRALPVILPLAVAAALVARRAHLLELLRRLLSRRRAPAPAASVGADPVVREAAELFASVERSLARRGLGIAPSETAREARLRLSALGAQAAATDAPRADPLLAARAAAFLEAYEALRFRPRAGLLTRQEGASLERLGLLAAEVDARPS